MPEEETQETHIEYCGYGGGAGDSANWTEVPGPDPNQRGKKPGKLELSIGIPLAGAIGFGVLWGGLRLLEKGAEYLSEHAEEILAYMQR